MLLLSEELLDHSHGVVLRSSLGGLGRFNEGHLVTAGERLVGLLGVNQALEELNSLISAAALSNLLGGLVLGLVGVDLRQQVLTGLTSSNAGIWVAQEGLKSVHPLEGSVVGSERNVVGDG